MEGKTKTKGKEKQKREKKEEDNKNECTGGKHHLSLPIFISFSDLFLKIKKNKNKIKNTTGGNPPTHI